MKMAWLRLPTPPPPYASTPPAWRPTALPLPPPRGALGGVPPTPGWEGAVGSGAGGAPAVTEAREAELGSCPGGGSGWRGWLGGAWLVAAETAWAGRDGWAWWFGFHRPLTRRRRSQDGAVWGSAGRFGIRHRKGHRSGHWRRRR